MWCLCCRDFVGRYQPVLLRQFTNSIILKWIFCSIIIKYYLYHTWIMSLSVSVRIFRIISVLPKITPYNHTNKETLPLNNISIDQNEILLKLSRRIVWFVWSVSDTTLRNGINLLSPNSMKSVKFSCGIKCLISYWIGVE